MGTSSASWFFIEPINHKFGLTIRIKFTFQRLTLGLTWPEYLVSDPCAMFYGLGLRLSRLFCLTPNPSAIPKCQMLNADCPQTKASFLFLPVILFIGHNSLPQ